MNPNHSGNAYNAWLPPTYGAPPPPRSSSTPATHFGSNTIGARPNRPAQLPSAVAHLQQQAQQSNYLAAAAAASLSSVLNTQQSTNDRTVLDYNDIAPSYPHNTQQSYPAPSFYCEACEKSFYKENQYQMHVKTHVQCTQCPFSASKNVLKVHAELVHGLTDPNKKPPRPDGIVPPDAPKLHTPEDIKKWIEERKKNWPSQKNMERKQKEEEEKRALGIMPSGQGNKRKLGNAQGGNGKRSKLDDSSTSENSSQSQNMAVENTPADKPATAPQHPLSGLIGYGSDSDAQNSDDEVMDHERDAISSKDPNSVGTIALPAEDTQKQKKSTRICRYFQRGNCSRGDSCIFLHEKRPKPARKPPQPHQRVEMFRTRSGLLERLLERDIKAEKNILLQCLRHIVQNDFFDASESNRK